MTLGETVGRTKLSFVSVTAVEKAFVVKFSLRVGRTAVSLVDKWSSVTLRERVDGMAVSLDDAMTRERGLGVADRESVCKTVVLLKLVERGSVVTLGRKLDRAIVSLVERGMCVVFGA